MYRRTQCGLHTDNMAFLKLIRYKNLIMITLMMLLIKLCSVDPMLKIFNLQPTFTWLDFVFLTLALTCVAAGGYVINDYFDIKTDRINRPDSLIIGREVSSATATTYHICLSIAGCVFGFLVSVRVGFWPLSLVFPFLVGLLWFYSTAYKGMFLVGNLVVALMIGIVPLLPSVYELRGLIIDNPPIVQEGGLDPYLILNISIGYAVFAFVTTLIREIIKDMEDIEGDSMQGCRTMAIVLGPTPCKVILSTLIISTIAALVYAYLYHVNEPSSGIFIGVALILPLLFLLYKVIAAKGKDDYHKCSTIAKIIMVLGMLYLFLVWYTFATFKDEF